MEPFGIPSDITIVYILGYIGVPIAIEVLLHTQWWKKQSEYYYSFNKQHK